MTDLMTDLESMGQTPGSAIVGIGACFFDTSTGQIGKTFYRAVNLATAMRVGLTVDASTVMWWMGQNEAARNAIRFSTYPIDQALSEFSEFVQETAGTQARIWAKGPSFDAGLLSAAYRACALKQPWHYMNERCVRTLVARNPAMPEQARVGEAHNALDDAVHQAQWLINIAEYHRARKQG